MRLRGGRKVDTGRLHSQLFGGLRERHRTNGAEPRCGRTKPVESVVTEFGFHAFGQRCTDDLKHRVRRVCRIWAMVQVNHTQLIKEGILGGTGIRLKGGDTFKMAGVGAVQPVPSQPPPDSRACRQSRPRPVAPIHKGARRILYRQPRKHRIRQPFTQGYNCLCSLNKTGQVST